MLTQKYIRSPPGTRFGFSGGVAAEEVHLQTQPQTPSISSAFHLLVISPFQLQKVMTLIPLFSGDFSMAPNCERLMHFLESPWAHIPAFQLNLCGLKSVSSYYPNFLLSGLSPSVTCRFVHHKNGSGAKNGINRSK